MKFGMPIGVNREWHPNGQLAMEAEFNESGRQLHRREWDENGRLTYEHAIDS